MPSDLCFICWFLLSIALSFASLRWRGYLKRDTVIFLSLTFHETLVGLGTWEVISKYFLNKWKKRGGESSFQILFTPSEAIAPLDSLFKLKGILYFLIPYHRSNPDKTLEIHHFFPDCLENVSKYSLFFLLEHYGKSDKVHFFLVIFPNFFVVCLLESLFKNCISNAHTAFPFLYPASEVFTNIISRLYSSFTLSPLLHFLGPSDPKNHIVEELRWWMPVLHFID